MPGVHLAQGVCIGTVFASDGMLFPEAVGTDIGCGMAAMRFVAEADIIVTPNGPPDTTASKQVQDHGKIYPALGCS